MPLIFRCTDITLPDSFAVWSGDALVGTIIRTKLVASILLCGIADGADWCYLLSRE
jgi:hypothetical protein